MTEILIMAGAVSLGIVFLWLCKKGFEKLDGITEGNKREAHTEPAAAGAIAPENYGTPLTMELVRKAVIFNGFVQISAEENWSTFKIQGDTYSVGLFDETIIFYKGFTWEKNDEGAVVSYNCMVDSASKINAVWINGLVEIAEDKGVNIIRYKVSGIEKTFEHLCISFMDYVNLLNSLICAHVDAYDILIKEKEALCQSFSDTEDKTRASKILS